MSSEYDLSLDGKDYRVEIKKLDEGGLLIVKVGPESFTLKVQPNDDGTWVVNDTYSDYSVKVVSRTGSKVALEVDGEKRDIEWSRVRKEVEVKASTSTTTQDGPRVTGGVYPPMPGKITEVAVKVGDKVKTGQTVCILEAMKMFNELKATNAGVVKEVNVETGSNVTPNDLLVLIE
ncbi:MAG: biotin/lipoyl-containing protein [Candidatus Thorarchaeota archaeon]|jgi:biotin carboxyl carrier protein